MANYIDQDDLLESVEQIAFEYDDPAMALVEIISTIEEWGHPLADPEIVKHGKWELKTEEAVGVRRKLFKCPYCGNALNASMRLNPPDYCSVCGARLEVPDNG